MGSPESGRMIVWSPRAWRARGRTPRTYASDRGMRRNNEEYRLTSRGSEASGGNNSGGKREDGEAHSDRRSVDEIEYEGEQNEEKSGTRELTR